MAGNDGNQFGEFVVRCGKSLAIHVILGAVLLAAGWWATSSFDSAGDQLKASYQEAPDAVAAVESVLADLRLRFWSWFVWALVISLLASCLFIGLAQQGRPGDERDGAARKPLWIILLIVVIAGCGTIWWRKISLADLAAGLTSGGYALLIGLGFVITFLAYWIATGLAVKRTMRPSVPLYYLLPTRWN